jgi:hypothetical protein
VFVNLVGAIVGTFAVRLEANNEGEAILIRSCCCAFDIATSRRRDRMFMVECIFKRSAGQCDVAASLFGGCELWELKSKVNCVIVNSELLVSIDKMTKL